MLQFIVLGLIPGTHLQITYTGMLVLLDIAYSLFAALVIYDFLWLKPQFLEYLQQQQSKSKSKKRKPATR